jgi:hypothetical protein
LTSGFRNDVMLTSGIRENGIPGTESHRSNPLFEDCERHSQIQMVSRGMWQVVTFRLYVSFGCRPISRQSWSDVCLLLCEFRMQRYRKAIHSTGGTGVSSLSGPMATPQMAGVTTSCQAFGSHYGDTDIVHDAGSFT